MSNNPSSVDNVQSDVERMTQRHPTAITGSEHPSQYDTAASSNYLAAKRDAEQQGKSQEEVWGPVVHGRDPKEVGLPGVTASTSQVPVPSVKRAWPPAPASPTAARTTICNSCACRSPARC
jgi:hypothetical protein